MTRLIVDIDAHAQTPALELATPHRSGRTTQREAGDDVRTSGYGRKTQVILDALVDVVEALWRERATRRKHRAQRLQAVVFSRDEGDFFHRIDVLRGRSELGHALPLGEVPKDLSTADEWGTIVEQ